MNKNFRLMTALLYVVVFGILALAQDVKSGSDSPLQVGNPNAAFKIEVFYDFQCPSCVPFNEELKRVRKRFPDKVFVTFRHFPLPMHDKSVLSARVVEAACRQDRCEEIINQLLVNQKVWAWNRNAKQILFGYARRLKLDMIRFKEDFESKKTIERIESDRDRAKSLGLSSVPSVILNGKELSYIEALDLEAIILKGNK
ncbi:MAG TPA: thioredoxin domain-containing protein [Pyrinomonadaceae bacterium]|jgi:predicted DsbA family dithiol-disulfide isomerase|nr:thioredoxin domain-containing protein [Pyrinomonadaceae bacterium]